MLVFILVNKWLFVFIVSRYKKWIKVGVSRVVLFWKIISFLRIIFIVFIGNFGEGIRNMFFGIISY